MGTAIIIVVLVIIVIFAVKSGIKHGKGMTQQRHLREQAQTYRR